MKKYKAYISGYIDIIVVAENAEQSEDRINLVCSGESFASDFGISKEHSYLLGQVSDWYVELVNEAPEEMHKEAENENDNLQTFQNEFDDLPIIEQNKVLRAYADYVKDFYKYQDCNNYPVGLIKFYMNDWKHLTVTCDVCGCFTDKNQIQEFGGKWQCVSCQEL